MNPSNANALLALGTALRQAGYRFMTVTPSTHRRINNRPGNERAHDLRGVFGWSRPFGRELLPASVLQLMVDAGVLEETGDGLRSLVRASTLDDMLLFHSAWPTRDDDAVFFGPDTYRFVNAMRRGFAFVGAGPERAVDIGCGGGAGALTIARTFPHAEVIGADINPKALELAMVNARLNGASNLALAQCDLFDGLQGDFDLVVSNPPFVVDPDARRYRHGGGELGAELSRRIAEQGLGRLAWSCAASATTSWKACARPWKRNATPGPTRNSIRTSSAASWANRATRTWNGSRRCGCTRSSAERRGMLDR
jgi:SAM-dependent methyltransferase